MREFVLATKNVKKLEEFREILKSSGFTVIPMDEAGYYFVIPENGATFSENAVTKARIAAKATGKPALADDSGLEISFMDNAPGINSARYMGYNTPYDDKNRAIIELMKDVPDDKRGARFVCAVAAVFPDGSKMVEEASVNGVISREMRGDNGFGYDPIFFIPKLGKTAAELTPQQKNVISHRGKALRLMRDRLMKEI